MEEWKEYRLGDVGIITTGKTPKTSVDEYYGGNIPFVTPADINTPYKYVTETVRYLTDKGLTSIASNSIDEGSICVSCIGNLGYAGIVQKRCASNQQINSITVRNEFDRDFVYYAIKRLWPLFKNHEGQSTTVSILNKGQFSKITIKCPSLVVQKRISSILSSLDDKIEVNRRINDNLEHQARTLFKSWFIDYEPCKDGDSVKTEIGRMPKDLLVKRVSEIPHTIETGRRPKGGVGEITFGIPSVGAEHVKGLGNYDYSKTKYITAEYAASLKTGKVNGYELLIYKDGGKPGYFIPNYSIFGEGYPFEECFLNEHVFKLDFGDKGYNAFCYFYFWTDYVMNYLNAQGGKAAIPGINRQDIENIQIYAPENELVKRFGDIVLPSIRQILFNCKESRHLAQLRDTLLPRLMSGELKVNEIERTVG